MRTIEILDIGGVESMTVRHAIIREEKQLLRRLVSVSVGTLVALNSRRALLGLSPLSETGDDSWHTTEELPATHLTSALIQRLRLPEAAMTLGADTLRMRLQNQPRETCSFTQGFRWAYQVREPLAGTRAAETGTLPPNYATIAEVLARPTRNYVELAFNDELDLPVKGRGNVLGSPPLMEALMEDLTLLRTSATML